LVSIQNPFIFSFHLCPCLFKCSLQILVHCVAVILFFLLTIKKICCKWIPFSQRDASHLTNTLFTARLSSAGQVEEATSQAPSSRISSIQQLYSSLYPSTCPTNKLTYVQIRWKGRSKSPCWLFFRHKNDTENCLLCEHQIRKTSPKQTHVFHAICSRLECNLLAETSPRVCKSLSSLEQISSELTKPLLDVRCSANVVYEAASCSKSPCRLKVTSKQLTASTLNVPSANQWVSCMVYKKACQREMTDHGCQIT